MEVDEELASSGTAFLQDLLAVDPDVDVFEGAVCATDLLETGDACLDEMLGDTETDRIS